MVTETDLVLGDGRTLHVYDTGTGDGAAGLALFWHHGTPGTGAPPEPLFAAAAARGIRWVSYDRPGYGGAPPPPRPGPVPGPPGPPAGTGRLGSFQLAVVGVLCVGHPTPRRRRPRRPAVPL